MGDKQMNWQGTQEDVLSAVMNLSNWSIRLKLDVIDEIRKAFPIKYKEEDLK